MSKYAVTFETKCYEKDWEIILKTSWLEDTINNCNYDFKERILYINNVADEEKVCFHAQKLLEKNIISKYLLVNNYADKALDFFNIEKESFNGGFYYSIQELVGIYLCETDYLLHFSSDATIKKPFNWIDAAIDKMVNTNDIVVANPTWNYKYNEAKNESLNESDDFFVGYGFSDQCYLIPTSKFKSPIYNEHNKQSERYPKYGGELFEKRVDAWMRNNDLKRITYKSGSYLHKNHPKNPIINKLYLTLKSSN